jgi:hypothetical protein
MNRRGHRSLTALVAVGLSVGAAGKVPAKVPELAVAWQLALPDRAAGIQAGLAVTQDGTVTAFDLSGRITWQQSFDAARCDIAAYGLIVVGATHAVLGFDRAEAALQDGGLVTCVISRDGNRRLRHRGRKATLGVRPDRSRRLSGGDAKNPKPYLAAMFAADGKSVVALTAQEAHVIADGRIVQRIGGVAGRVAPVREGASILLSDGGEKVLVLSEGKISSSISVAKTGIVGLSGGAVGTEMDGGSDSSRRQIAGSTRPAEAHERVAAKRRVAVVLGRLVL